MKEKQRTAVVISSSATEGGSTTKAGATSDSTTTTTTTKATTTVPTTTTTTGTTKDPLKLDCLPYKCEKDSSILDKNEHVNASAVSGTFITSCGTTYFFSKGEKPWVDANTECCKMNMQLLSVETAAEQDCISKMLKGPAGTALQGSYWTSGSDEFHDGIFCWCASNKAVNVSMDFKFAPGEPNNFGGKENCIQSAVSGEAPPNTFIYNDNGCEKPFKYICDAPARPCPMPECPSYTCETDPTKLNDAKNWKSNGDGKFFLSCGKQYFFSNTPRTKVMAEAECCKYGMKLITVDTEEEIKCLSDSNMGLSEKSHAYWTSASNEGVGCDENWGWCNTNTLFPSNFSRWFPGEPIAAAVLKCAQIRFDPDISKIGFNTLGCTTERYFLCEADLPACTAPECPALKCETEAAKVELSTKWKKNADGEFRKACGNKQYFISKLSKTKLEVETECCKYGLKLLAIDSPEELACIAEMNAAELRQTTHKYWTSGTNEGQGCVNKWGWCSTKSFVYANFTQWETGGKPDNPMRDRCIQIKLDIDPKKMFFDDLSCTESRYFICEGEVADCSPTCPDDATCVKDVTNFNSKDQLLKVGTFGKWTSGCNRTYLYSTNKVPWDKAYENCCKLGMDLVEIDDENKMQCLFELNNNNSLLKFNDEFWTGAVQKDCCFRFKYCGTGNTFYRNNTIWVSGQPDNYDETQECVNAVFGTAATYSKDKAKIFDNKCADTKGYICEMPEKRQCDAVTCPDYNCTVDDAKVNQSKAWKTPNKDYFRSICGRQYLIHDASKNWFDAYKECCTWGLRLLRVETLNENTCLYNAFKKYGWGSTDFWSAATSDGINCERKWAWCPNGTDFVADEVGWAPGEPTTPFGEQCAVWQYNSNGLGNSKLADWPCSTEKRFICEGEVPECLPTCPETKCDKDTSKFDGNGKLANPNQYGEWRQACNNTYLHRRVGSGYVDAWKFCCSVGMELLGIDDDNEIKCIEDFNNAVLGFNGGNWVLSASSIGCTNRYFNCPIRKGLDGPAVLENNTRWLPGECNTETILMLRLSVNQPLRYWDAHVGMNTYYFCEGNDPR